MFALPGGALLLPLLARFLPFELLPSAFLDADQVGEAAEGQPRLVFHDLLLDCTVTPERATAAEQGRGGAKGGPKGGGGLLLEWEDEDELEEARRAGGLSEAQLRHVADWRAAVERDVGAFTAAVDAEIEAAVASRAPSRAAAGGCVVKKAR